MMKPAAGTAAPEAITPFMKARREVGLRATPVRTPTAETASVADPSLSDMAVSPYAHQAVTRSSRRPRELRLRRRGTRENFFASFYRTDLWAAQGVRRRLVAVFGWSSSLLDDDLAVHPRVRRADVEVVARLGEGDGLRLALLQYAGVPIAFPVGGRGVRDVADIGEGYGGPRFDPSPSREIRIFDVVGADIDLVGIGDDRSGRAGNLGRRRRRP